MSAAAGGADARSGGRRHRSASGLVDAIGRRGFEVVPGCGDDVRVVLHDAQPTA